MKDKTINLLIFLQLASLPCIFLFDYWWMFLLYNFWVGFCIMSLTAQKITDEDLNK